MEIAQLDELCSLIAEHRDVAEETAKLDPAVVEAAGKAGLWVGGAPKEVGGLELGLAELLALCERIGEADASVAWHIVNSGGAGHAAAFVPDSIRRQVFASTLHPFGFSGAVAAGIKVARDTGGFRLAGTWPFMTGVLDADWACVTVVMPAEQGEDGQPPDVRRVFMPLGACEVHRTWDNATSMRGTGSHASNGRRGCRAGRGNHHVSSRTVNRSAGLSNPLPSAVRRRGLSDQHRNSEEYYRGRHRALCHEGLGVSTVESTLKTHEYSNILPTLRLLRTVLPPT